MKKKSCWMTAAIYKLIQHTCAKHVYILYVLKCNISRYFIILKILSVSFLCYIGISHRVQYNLKALYALVCVVKCSRNLLKPFDIQIEKTCEENDGNLY